MNAELIQNLWCSFDLISSELALAKRALREDCGDQDDVDWLRLELLAIASELADLGEMADCSAAG